MLRAIVFFIAKATSFPVFFFWFRCKITKEEKYAAKDINNSIIYANHASYLDPLLLLYVFPQSRLKFVMNRTVAEKNGFLRWILKTVGCVSINKENFSLADLSEMMKVLDEEKTLVIFPEGQITETGEIGPFRDGMALIACYAKVKLRPVFLYKPKKFFHRKRITIGKAFGYEDIKGIPNKAEVRAISEEARDALVALQKNTEV